MATGNYNKLQLHKQAYELLEAIIQKEEWLARERGSLRKLTVRRDYILEVQIPYVKHRIALYERFLQIANKNYALLSGKICKGEEVRELPKYGFDLEKDFAEMLELQDKHKQERLQFPFVSNIFGPDITPDQLGHWRKNFRDSVMQSIDGWNEKDMFSAKGLIEPVDVPYMDHSKNAGFW